MVSNQNLTEKGKRDLVLIEKALNNPWDPMKDEPLDEYLQKKGGLYKKNKAGKDNNIGYLKNSKSLRFKGTNPNNIK